MNSGMYAALSGNLAAVKRMDIISNNLANVNTPGYKRDRMSFESMLAGSVNPPAVPQGSTADPILQKENVYVDFTSGSVSQTGNPLDISIEGDGFFTVTTPTGPAYTRQGNFRLSTDGTIVTADGYPVAGQAGPIRVAGGKVEIDAQGQVMVDGEPAGTISVVDFPKPYQLNKIGSALFVPANADVVPQPVAASRVAQGQLEGSNVDSIGEMMAMLETNRYFEACAKVVRNYDDIAARAANDVGRVV